jgi:hypothetical protein
MESLEIWKPVPDFEGYYEVSNYGRVKSLSRTIKYTNNRVHNTPGKIIKLGKHRNGYLVVRLYKNQNEKKWLVHRLVATVFIPNLEEKPQINHIDGNKANNNVDNLEWATASENGIHAFKTGLNIPSSKLSEEEVIAIKVLLSKNVKHTFISRIFNVTPQAIWAINQNKNLARFNNTI